MKQVLILSILLIAISSCTPKVNTTVMKSYPALRFDDEIMIFTVQEDAPREAVLLGELKIGDTGFSTKCSYEFVMNIAKLEARKIGGNIVKLTDYKPPSALGSTCHRIEAKIMRVDDPELLTKFRDEETEVMDVPYALLHVYRYAGAGSLVGYNLHLGEDSVLCRVQNNYKTVLKIPQEGEYVIWAKTESRAEVSLTLEHGRSYYLQCGIEMGALVGRPTLQLVSPRMGKAQFESFEAKNE